MVEQAAELKTIGLSSQGKHLRDNKRTTGLSIVQTEPSKEDDDNTSKGDDEGQAHTDRGDNDSNQAQRIETEKKEQFLRTSNPKVKVLAGVEQKRHDRSKLLFFEINSICRAEWN
jgi:hypothetical protein